MTLVRAFAGTLVAFFVVDAIWILGVAGPMYERQIGGLLRPHPHVGSVVVFYLVYVAGIVYFAVLPALASGGVRTALVRGAALGGVAYGTYSFTNHALLSGWTLALVAADMAWGLVVTALAAAGGSLAARRRS